MKIKVAFSQNVVWSIMSFKKRCLFFFSLYIFQKCFWSQISLFSFKARANVNRGWNCRNHLTGKKLKKKPNRIARPIFRQIFLIIIGQQCSILKITLSRNCKCGKSWKLASGRFFQPKVEAGEVIRGRGEEAAFLCWFFQTKGNSTNFETSTATIKI